MSMFSLNFLLYFLPIVVIVYHILRASLRAQNVWLLCACLFFYGWVDTRNLFLLLLMMLVNYELGAQAGIAKANDRSTKWITRLTIVLNVGCLLYYRYLSPFMQTVAGMTGLSMFATNIVAPLGIAFLSMKGISYVMDIIHGKVEPETSFVNCALYFSFFPTLFAGPLIRYHDVAAQIRVRNTTWEGFSRGFCRFIVGLTKNALLAQPLSVMVDNIFTLSDNSGLFTTVPILTILIGLLGLVLQLYYYLSGMSDMVIGLGGMFGFSIPENFRYPILATSVMDFWLRAYTSLFTWFDEYIRAPLNANKRNQDKLVRNSLFMWAFIGIWLGPSLTNLLFGLWNFAFILLEDIVDIETSSIKKPLRRIYTFVVVLLGLVAYRSYNIYTFSLFVTSMFGGDSNSWMDASTLMFIREYWALFAFGLLFLFPIAPWLREKISHANKLVNAMGAGIYCGLLFLAVVLAFTFIFRGSYSPALWLDFNLWGIFHG